MQFAWNYLRSSLCMQCHILRHFWRISYPIYFRRRDCSVYWTSTINQSTLNYSYLRLIDHFQSGAPFAVTHQKLTKYDRQPIKFNGSDNVIKSKLTVNDQTKFQTIVGFGGAHTGAVTYLLQQLPQSLQDSIYESYYSATKGLGYTITRVPIGGCDFDLAPWAYNESPVNDKKLSNFTQLNKHDMDRVGHN